MQVWKQNRGYCDIEIGYDTVPNFLNGIQIHRHSYGASQDTYASVYSGIGST